MDIIFKNIDEVISMEKKYDVTALMQIMASVILCLWSLYTFDPYMYKICGHDYSLAL